MFKAWPTVVVAASTGCQKGKPKKKHRTFTNVPSKGKMVIQNPPCGSPVQGRVQTRERLKVHSAVRVQTSLPKVFPCGMNLDTQPHVTQPNPRIRRWKAGKGPMPGSPVALFLPSLLPQASPALCFSGNFPEMGMGQKKNSGPQMCVLDSIHQSNPC